MALALDTRTPARSYVNLFGQPMQLAKRLVLVVLALVAILIACVLVIVRQQQQLATVQPLVVRISEVGRADVVQYDPAATIKPSGPSDPTTRFFLSNFVEKYLARTRTTVRRDYTNSLRFLSTDLVDRVTRPGPSGKTDVEAFLADQTADDIEVVVQNVQLTNWTDKPYQGVVVFQEVAYGPGPHIAPKKTTNATATIVFTTLDRIPNDYVPVNPLGFVITNLRIDRGF